MELPAVTKVMTDFAACGRCSYFWAGYRVIAGEEGVETAVNGAEDGWLTLTWNQTMRELVHKSYGVMVDANFFHYESCCQECHRIFTCSPITEEEAETAGLPERVPAGQSLEPAGTPAAAIVTAETAIVTAETAAVEIIAKDALEAAAIEEPETKTSTFDFRIQLLRQNPVRRP